MGPMPDVTDREPEAPESDPYEEIDEAKKRGLMNERFVGDPELARVLAGTPLVKGARGSGVKRVQGALVDMSFALPGGADGSYGRQTEKAVRNFQVNAVNAFPDVSPTGELDAATLRALDELAPPPGHRGQSSNIPAPYFEGAKVRVVVLKDEHRTFLFDRKGHLSAIYMNAVGASATSTSEGLKVVVSKLDEEAAREVGERLWNGPVFGARIIDLSWVNGHRSGEELHGTISPGELGQDVSHGCVRHANPDIIALYEAIHVGEKVAIVSGLCDPRLHA